MVFTTVANLVRARGPDEFWRKRRIFKLASHLWGRRRNCYKIALQAVHRSMQHAAIGREVRRTDIAELWTQRITAGAEQHGLQYHDFIEGLHQNNIQLNRKTLADLAAWEPATFEALAKISSDKIAGKSDAN